MGESLLWDEATSCACCLPSNSSILAGGHDFLLRRLYLQVDDEPRLVTKKRVGWKENAKSIGVAH